MKNNLSIAGIGFAAMVISASSALAQSESFWALELERAASTKMELNGSKSDEMSFTTTEVGATFGQPIGSTSMLIGSLGYGSTEYEFDGFSQWGDVKNYSASAFLDTQIGDSWSLVTIGFMESAYESGASFGDSITWGAGLGGRYQVSDTLSYLLGVIYVSRLDDDSLVIPVLGVEWQITERLALEGMMGLNLLYDLTGDGKNVLSAGLDYNLIDFRRKDGADGASRTIRPEGFGFTVGYTRQLTDWISFSVSGTGISESKFKSRYKGKTEKEFKYDAGFVGAAGFTFMF